MHFPFVRITYYSSDVKLIFSGNNAGEIRSGNSMVAFLAYFGEPKVIVNLLATDDARLEEYRLTPEGEADERDEEEEIRPWLEKPRRPTRRGRSSVHIS